MGVSIEKKKNQPEQKIKKEANFCSGWFFFFSIDTPINLDQDGCINRKEKNQSEHKFKKEANLCSPPWIKLMGVSIEKKKKTTQTGVGFLIQNHFICDCMES